MKNSIIIGSLLATLALAKPLEKRAVATEYDWSTVTVTVTGDAAVAAATDAAKPWGPGAWHWGSASAAAPAPAPTTAAAPAPAPAAPSPAAVQSSGGWGSSAAAPAASSAAASSGDVSSYAQAILDQHNNHRANHSVPALSWSDDMASIAQQIASSCVYAHNTAAGGGGYGQNIGAGSDSSGVPAMITDEMYNDEIGFYPTPYGQANPDMSQFENWGHFSQIVWKSTTSVGCYTQYCPGGLSGVGSGVSPYFTVCNYSPPGNFGGEYGDNVLAPGGAPTVTV